MNRAVAIICNLTIAIGVTAVAVSIWSTIGGDQPEWWMLIALLVGTIVGEVATVAGDTDDGEQAFSFAATGHLAAAMLLPPGWAALAAGAGSAVGEVIGKARPYHAALNASLATFCTFMGSLAFHAVEGDAASFSTHTYLGVLAMIVVYIPLNVVPPGLVTTLMSSQRLRPLAWLPPADFVAFLMEVCLAAAVALVLMVSPAFLVFLIPLLVAVFLSLKRSRLLVREARNTLRTLVTIIDAKDPSTAAHSERVGDLAASLGEAIGLANREVHDLRWAGRLHDIGKIAVDDAVLRKAGPLTAAEWELMRRHPAVAAELLDALSITRSVTPAVRYHHERADGQGYYLIDGDDVPLGAAIISVVDAFDAMTSSRPYRQELSFDDALGRIAAGSGSQFEPAVAAAFVAMMQGREVEPVSNELDGWRGALRQRLQDMRRARGNGRDAEHELGPGPELPIRV